MRNYMMKKLKNTKISLKDYFCFFDMFIHNY